MKIVLSIAISLSMSLLHAEPTPMDQQIPMGKPFTIAAVYDMQERLPNYGDTPGQTLKGEYHYDVYLPNGYDAEKDKSFPCLFVMSPGGNAKLGKLTKELDRLKWIGIALHEAKNGPWEPIVGNYLSAHDDAIKRFRIEEGKKFATGFSGGSRGSSLFAQMRPGVAGVILQGAGFMFDKPGKYYYKDCPKENFKVFMIMGKQDSNAVEVENLRKQLPKSIKFKSEFFDGKHQPAPEELMSKALDWISSDSI